MVEHWWCRWCSYAGSNGGRKSRWGGTHGGGGGGNELQFLDETLQVDMLSSLVEVDIMEVVVSGTMADGAGGGGSGYIHPTLITDGRTIKRSRVRDADGSFRIEIVSSTKLTTISGANTENLSITTDDDAAGVIRCKVTADDVQESPVFSGSGYYVVAKRNVIKIEQYDYTNATATLSEEI